MDMRVSRSERVQLWALLVLFVFVGLGMVALAAVMGGSEGFGLWATRAWIFGGVLTAGWGVALVWDGLQYEAKWAAIRRPPAWQRACREDAQAVGLLD